MLVLESVSYRYAGAARPSLREVSLALPDGEVVGLAGPSEAGKTTLCLVASGLAPRTVGGTLTGRVLLDGEDAAPLPIHQLAGRIGIAFASPATQLSGVADTVYEEVAFGPMNLGLPRDDVIGRTEEALAELRIEALAPPQSGAAVRRAAAAGRHRRACWPCGRACWCSTSRPRSWTPPAAGWWPMPWPAWPVAAPRS